MVVLGSELEAGVRRIPTGVRDVDRVTGGGIPVGKVTELYGIENVGKTTLAYRIMASAQRVGDVWFVDGEGQVDPAWMRKQGVDLDRCVVIRPIPAEAVLDAVVEGVKRGVSLVVLDSIASLEPLKALNKDIDQRSPGLVPILVAETLRKVVLFQRRSGTAVVFLNQMREAMSVGRPLYGADTLVTPGGRALRHFAHLRLEMRRAESIYRKVNGVKSRVGHVVAVRVTKSKVGRPWSECRVKFIYGRGFVDE